MSDEIPAAGFVPSYRLRLHPKDSVFVRPVIGAESSVNIALMLRDHRAIESARQIGPQGAILGLDMNPALALELYRQIGNLARTMGWPLPKLDEDPE